MRLFALTLLALCTQSVLAAEPAYPLWNGGESVNEYARRAGLSPTKTLHLGDGVTMEFVLIPAGTFTMGTPEPESVDEEYFARQTEIGHIALVISVAVLLILLGYVMVHAVRGRHRPQVSLVSLLVATIVAGTGLMGGLHWHASSKGLADALVEYRSAIARYTDSCRSEKPARQVTISRPYYVGQFEVTQEQYFQVMGNHPSDVKKRDLPVETVMWEDARTFCRKTSRRMDVVMRLPTDAEWERACRAGTRTAFYTGDTETDLSCAAWHEKNSKSGTHPVGQKTPNAWGVYDMHGNVWEWCSDWYQMHKAEVSSDPDDLPGDVVCALRGGSWASTKKGCRSAYRRWGDPDYQDDLIGFRAVIEVP